MTKNVLPWGVFAAFAVGALVSQWHDDVLSFGGPLAAGKALVWVAFLLFLGYSIYCSTRENLFRTVGTLAGLHWGRQIGIDLYLGLFLMLFIIWLHEGSLIVVALWLLPVLLFANLAVLLYVAIHFDAIVSRFIM